MIAPFARPRAIVASLNIPPAVLSLLTLAALTLVVVGGFAVSVLSPLLFSGAFSGVNISASDLTPFMNGW